MDSDSPNFIARLKTAALGSAEHPLVFLGNFEVEELWAADELGLPRVSAAGSTAVVNSMDEFALLLGGKGDHVVLKHAPDPDYHRYLLDLGFELPEVHVVAAPDPARNVSQDALADPALVATLAELATDGAHLLPHGASAVEEELAARTGVPLATPSAALCKSVNSKVYSRQLADELGLRQPHGWVCDTPAQLAEAVPEAAKVLAEGGTVVVKEAYGVSGKGIAVVTNEQRLLRLQRMIERTAQKAGRDRIALVTETWVDKLADLNYQFTVGRDGSVRFDFVKEAITENGVHKGHRMPARLDERQHQVIRDAADALGARLAKDGYYGVVGVDALVEPDGGIFPVLEINARNNMSTYQVPLQERFVPAGAVAMARHYPVRLAAPLPFARLRETLGELLFAGSGSGLLVNNFATVNAGAGVAAAGEAFAGRLYGVLIGPSAETLDELDHRITERLATLAQDQS
ncbi:ATP-grasp domain-containing protein [Amycolatopsis sp. CA-126428]|uniref:preATP grasp domain-containing protein n=1 Tax=Amycolatopsis sp. CA-126428 TaxID=2073158 RepID=UPI000CCFE2DB|nr:ATP-grasp domain-containing protein [Amycolatopsis sp. CA-126428]